MTTNSEFNEGVKTDAHDIDRGFAARLDEAEGVLSRFVNPEDLAPRTQIDITDLVLAKASAAGLNMDDEGDRELAISQIQAVVKERCVNALTRLDRVVLDLDGSYGSQPWLAPDVPAIVFCAVKSADGTLRNSIKGETVRAMAVYFDPSLAGTRSVTNKTTGEVTERPNVYEPSAYVSIVGTYGSLIEAKNARHELMRAVSVIGFDPTDSALESDPVRTVGMDSKKVDFSTL